MLKNRMLQRAMLAPMVIMLISAMAVVGAVYADGDECDVHQLVELQQEYGTVLTNLEVVAQADLNAGLVLLYQTGAEYQQLALDCGFTPMDMPDTSHNTSHNDGHSEEETHVETNEDVLALAETIGDPMNGEVLFNTLTTETGFSCALCHNTDSAERLVGPGLLGVADPEHDHAMHGADEMSSDTAEATEHAEGDAHTEDEHAEDGHADDDEHAEEEQHDDAMMDMDAFMARTEYLRTSIINPSDFVVPDYPDLVMPQVYAELFTEQEINDLIAYLVTLQ